MDSIEQLKKIWLYAKRQIEWVWKCCRKLRKGDSMEDLNRDPNFEQENIKLEPFGKEGYRIIVGGGYPFEASASNRHLSFTVENRDQRDSLIQILSDVLDLVKYTVIQEKIMDQINKNIEQQVLSVINEALDKDQDEE